MKKLTTILLVLLMLMLSACAQTQNVSDNSSLGESSLQNTPSSKEENSSYVGPYDDPSTPPTPKPPSPKQFNTMDDAIAFIKNPDLTKFKSDFRDDYQKMVETFKEDGYVTTLTHSVATPLEGYVTLYPQTPYEDIGVDYDFRFKGVTYHILIYNIREGFSVNKQTETVLDYYAKKRGKVPPVLETASTKNASLPSIMFFETPYTINADALIDEGHYINVRVELNKATTAEIVEFIEGLSLGKIPIE